MANTNIDYHSTFNEVGNGLTLRQQQERKTVLGEYSPTIFKQYVNSSAPKGVGEYSPSIDDQIKRCEYFRENRLFKLEEHDLNERFDKFMPRIDEFHRKGLQFGLFTGLVTYFFPVIRRLPFYYRIPITAAGFYFPFNFFRNIGKDITYKRLSHHVLLKERFAGTRNYQTAF